jgi:hypothetical protein
MAVFPFTTGAADAVLNVEMAGWHECGCAIVRGIQIREEEMQKEMDERNWSKANRQRQENKMTERKEERKTELWTTMNRVSSTWSRGQ